MQNRDKVRQGFGVRCEWGNDVRVPGVSEQCGFTLIQPLEQIEQLEAHLFQAARLEVARQHRMREIHHHHPRGRLRVKRLGQALPHWTCQRQHGQGEQGCE